MLWAVNSVPQAVSHQFLWCVTVNCFAGERGPL